MLKPSVLYSMKVPKRNLKFSAAPLPDALCALPQLVRPVVGDLYLPRICFSYYEGYESNCLEVHPNATMTHPSLSFCGHARHNNSYFSSYQQCTPKVSGRPQSGFDCFIYNQENGIETDFYLYVTALDSDVCEGTTTAYAQYCVLDVVTNRPLAGAVNFCPDKVAVSDHASGKQLEKAVHEILHALVIMGKLVWKSISQRPDGLSKDLFNTGGYFSSYFVKFQNFLVIWIFREKNFLERQCSVHSFFQYLCHWETVQTVVEKLIWHWISTSFYFVHLLFSSMTPASSTDNLSICMPGNYPNHEYRNDVVKLWPQSCSSDTSEDGVLETVTPVYSTWEKFWTLPDTNGIFLFGECSEFHKVSGIGCSAGSL